MCVCIYNADWSIGVRPGAVQTFEIQYRTAEFNITNSILPIQYYHQPRGDQPVPDLESYSKIL